MIGFRPRPWPALALLAGLLYAALVVSFGYGAAKPSPAYAGFNPAALRNTPRALARQGRLIFDHTPRYAAPYAGNQLSCASCHLDSGTRDFSAPMIGLAGLFPMFSKRAGHVISLQNRIQECFVRSEAGTPPPVDSYPMRALVAYIRSLSGGQIKGKPYPGRGLLRLPPLAGNPKAGRSIYLAQCAMCHGANGAGIPSAFPPVWGKGSYNTGAGMNNPAKMAAFLVRNMPQNKPGTLTPQQASDVAAYIHLQPRPRLNPAYAGY